MRLQSFCVYFMRSKVKKKKSKLSEKLHKKKADAVLPCGLQRKYIDAGLQEQQQVEHKKDNNK